MVALWVGIGFALGVGSVLGLGLLVVWIRGSPL